MKKVIGFDGSPIEGPWGFGVRAAIIDTGEDTLFTLDGRKLTRERFAELADGETVYVTRVEPPIEVDATDGMCLLYRHKDARFPLDPTIPWRHRGDIAVAFVTRDKANYWLGQRA